MMTYHGRTRVKAHNQIWGKARNVDIRVKVQYAGIREGRQCICRDEHLCVDFLSVKERTHHGRTRVKREVMTVPMKMSAILAYMNLTEPWLPGAELYCRQTAVVD